MAANEVDENGDSKSKHNELKDAKTPIELKKNADLGDNSLCDCHYE